jgi:hypothetical protein
MVPMKAQNSSLTLKKQFIDNNNVVMHLEDPHTFGFYDANSM